jgi:hypothetical protein
MVEWDELIANPSIEWTIGMLREFEDEINWFRFYQSDNFKWDYSSILEFQHKLKPLGINMDELYLKATFPEKFKPTGHYELPDAEEEYDNEYGEESNEDLDEEYDEEYGEEYDNEYQDESANEYSEASLIRDGVTILKSFDDVHDFVSSYPSPDRIDFTDKIAWSSEAISYVLSIPNIDILHISTFSILLDAARVLKENSEKLIWGKRMSEIAIDRNNHVKNQEYIMGITANKNIVWTCAMLDEFSDRLNWDFLSSSGKFEWTRELGNKHLHKFNQELLFRNESFYEFLIVHVLNVELLEKIFGEDKKNMENIDGRGKD